jgi:hypothetical protein
LIVLARYVARAARYTHGIGDAETALVNGIEMETKKSRTARFQAGVLLDHETEAGLKHFTFKGLADGVPPETRLSVFDTRDAQKSFGWTDEEREAVEAKLDNSPAFGADFIKVEELRAPKPFPSYDEKEPEEILELVTAAGVEPDVAYRYEVENEARQDLLDAFSELGADAVGVPQEVDFKLNEGESIFKPTGELIVRA